MAMRQAHRLNLSREELELMDVEKQMEDQLIAQHRLVERVVASKTGEDGVVKYLTKARRFQNNLLAILRFYTSK